MTDAAFDRRTLDASCLNADGLNLQAVFDLAALPATVLEPLHGHDPRYRQLILLGHGGSRLWQQVQVSGIASEHPIDDFTRRTVGEWAAGQLPGRAWKIVYPDHQSTRPVGLQALGKLAGWHHDSPFMVGINPQWGSWFAYRAVLLADSDFAPTPRAETVSPCLSCVGSPCIAACPGAAMDDGRFALDRCVTYRQSQGSRCQTSCLARLRCPVAAENRYPAAQMAHTYAISLQMIARYYGRPKPTA